MLKKVVSPVKHLLIISCSKSKNNLLKTYGAAKLPALEGYDGKLFLTIRKALREGLGKNVDVLIISAKYGLLKSTEEISYYEERMTKPKAQEIRDSVLSKLINHINGQNYKKIFVMMGRDYLGAISGLSSLTDIPIDVIQMEKIGKAQQKLKNLLLKINSQTEVS